MMYDVCMMYEYTCDVCAQVFNSLGKQAYALNVGAVSTLPTTCIRFRPTGSSSKTKNVVITGSKWMYDVRCMMYDV